MLLFPGGVEEDHKDHLNEWQDEDSCNINNADVNYDLNIMGIY